MNPFSFTQARLTIFLLITFLYLVSLGLLVLMFRIGIESFWILDFLLIIAYAFLVLLPGNFLHDFFPDLFGKGLFYGGPKDQFAWILMIIFVVTTFFIITWPLNLIGRRKSWKVWRRDNQVDV